MSEVDHIKNVTIVGIGTQGSMIAFRNALYGKNVTGYSRTQLSIDTCKNKIDKWARSLHRRGEADKGRGRRRPRPHPLRDNARRGLQGC